MISGPEENYKKTEDKGGGLYYHKKGSLWGGGLGGGKIALYRREGVFMRKR